MVTPACPSHPRARVRFVWRHSRCRARARPEAYNGRYTGRTPMETMKRAGLLVLMLSLAAIAAATACRGQRRGTVDAPKMVIIGFDGMDPDLVRRYIGEGRMPNMARLAA